MTYCSPVIELPSTQLLDESSVQSEVRGGTENDRIGPIKLINETLLLQILNKPQAGRHPGFDVFSKASLAYVRLSDRINGARLTDNVIQQVVPEMLAYLREHQSSRLTDEQFFFTSS